ncbi:MAG TPA: hypothetical protein VMB26_08670, partial [Candidatus Binataceae bacterium]|nr:hypothetical protein [Candidatus Binataceae bacterium]
DGIAGAQSKVRREAIRLLTKPSEAGIPHFVRNDKVRPFVIPSEGCRSERSGIPHHAWNGKIKEANLPFPFYAVVRS